MTTSKSNTDEPKTAKTTEQIEGKRDLLKALGICLLAVLLVRTLLFEPFKIPTSSMVPTLEIGDHIFVSKYNYGVSIPFTTIQLLSWGAPKRGDVVVFLFPKDKSLHYIKRVMAVPGDTIEFKGKDILVNGELIQKELVSDPAVLKRLLGENPEDVELFEERIEGHQYYVRYSKKKHHQLLRISQETTVPEGEYFMLGDNRDDSYDSRSWGMVSQKDIKGKAQVIWLSMDQEGAWDDFSKLRWSRSGKVIN